MKTKAKAYVQALPLAFKLVTCTKPVSLQGRTRKPLTLEPTSDGLAPSVPLMKVTESLLHMCPLSLCLLTQPCSSEVLCNASLFSGTCVTNLLCSPLTHWSCHT